MKNRIEISTNMRDKMKHIETMKHCFRNKMKHIRRAAVYS